MSRIRMFLSSGYIILTGYTLIVSILFGSILSHEFAVVDDLRGIVENPSLLNLKANLLTALLGQIAPSVLVTYFGLTPLPFHLLAIVVHILCGFFTYLLGLKTGLKRIYAALAGLVFLVHPINTEALNWISALMYIFSTLTILFLIYNHAQFLELPTKKRFIIQACIYLFFIIFFRNAWVFTLIPLIYVYESYILPPHHIAQYAQKRKLYVLYILGCVLFLVLLFPPIAINRIASQPPTNAQMQLNQQALIPILEGYPYSLSRMTISYLYPYLLTIYDDGVQITRIHTMIFYLVSAAYVSLIYYTYRLKKRQLFGFLLLLPICIAPVFSPYKVTWFFTDRYAYIGSPFYAIFLVLLIQRLSYRNLKISGKIAIILVYICVLTAKTVSRNNEWQTPETLAVATIRSSPYSIRAYNDLAGYFYLKKRIPESKRAFARTLRVGPSLVAMENLGLIYSQYGFDRTIQTKNWNVDQIIKNIEGYMRIKDYRVALYFINEGLVLDPVNPQLHIFATQACIELRAWRCAQSELAQAKHFNVRQTDYYFLRGYLNFQTHRPNDAERDLLRVLSLDPSYPGARENLDYIQSH